MADSVQTTDEPCPTATGCGEDEFHLACTWDDVRSTLSGVVLPPTGASDDRVVLREVADFASIRCANLQAEGVDLQRTVDACLFTSAAHTEGLWAVRVTRTWVEHSCANEVKDALLANLASMETELDTQSPQVAVCRVIAAAACKTHHAATGVPYGRSYSGERCIPINVLTDKACLHLRDADTRLESYPGDEAIGAFLCAALAVHEALGESSSYLPVSIVHTFRGVLDACDALRCREGESREMDSGMLNIVKAVMYLVEGEAWESRDGGLLLVDLF